MGERVIRTADLRNMESYLNNLGNSVNIVAGQIENVGADLNNTKNTLDQLINEFHQFVRSDQLQKNVQLAETRLVKVRQELETEYGHYGDVRRRVNGILQAVDTSLIKKETIENASEDQMLAAPRYWLAPCLIALSAWINDNKELAEKAMNEAIRRDNEKTALFFALVTRRGARYKASRKWLENYFGLQDPHQLEREIVVLIDGFTNGIFGPDARIKCGKKVESWIEELSQKVGFVEEQREQWKVALESKSKKVDEELYPYLREFGKNWGEIEQSLEGVKLHKIIADYFQDVFAKEVTPVKSIAVAVDALLDTLVSRFDDEELPLRRDERLLSLVIQENGDQERAEKLFEEEKVIENQISFTQLLTNFSIHPEVSNASIATQKFSISLSKDWIKSAHEDLTAENRANVPIDINLSIDQWEGVTQDGTNEEELIVSINNHVEKRRNAALSKVKLGVQHWAGLIGGILFTLTGFGVPFLFILAGFCYLYFYLGRRNLRSRKAHISSEFDQLSKYCTENLRASIAEVVDYRRDYKENDANAQLVTEFLDGISPEQYTFSSFDSARSVQ
ncbi:hypothetical protein ACFSKI_11275 [Pseudogracilibacillus auburnensis]|uniref:Uncharacterized protein n=1 Tax=Pseudogracilibacillus auburnensis TaxID=1494959 RepID=A0A2V3VPA0_9BACI|nr:hypothetical protein [Pseudogracilibacillus auburnensis]MBO1001864.1 hypothetical protein [Pseudogracilibacillus auburnensis]PXW83350.1 hypothetical protein DFR56_11629 [Pseudogracilibacillus auburnensis]